jgi:hypothetical protein
MFAALREYFARPEAPVGRRGRGRRLAQLFVFEFVVVLLGVLAAALLQDWFAERKDARSAQAAVAALDEETRRFADAAEYRMRAHDCETARLARLGELIRTGGTATEAERDSPLMPMPVITDWSEDTKQIVTRHVGKQAVNRYGALRLLAQMISERQRQLEDQWADFLLLRPGAGSEANRGDLALAVARSSGLLAAIDMNAAYVRQYAPDIKPDEKQLAQLAKMDHPCAAAALKPVPPSANQQ